ncbi:TPA: hydrogenase formation protein HypD [Pseudomonas aeruginosa]|uniref:Hydrogenase maturation factor n=1 Tax=Pseudomonas citronellolis TaxID=53408 RepID=A0A1A9KFG3_9PSED|nr:MULTISPECIES: hydrogenase formation protein HypD [Pseudomonas]ANI16258.1 hydrogenase formation protein HypD [Pseudomonas citronellolis]EJU9614706.1 hydrogenase formation protein HypD [Pseudomonas aeruginosa]EKU2931523.1 hydrogenase formation protein HypD [Pseudomonas aeruginosa]EKX3870076.1 hydrogenase formation protein HypD [Pseudomonas aeruginosa]ELM0223576.1 hydrogenase formation protein HypD [Pseudomonas aeruginosa]
MKYIDEYRDGELARQIAARIAQAARPERDYRFMEFCGGHTHAISRYGVSDLLPGNVRMIHGPGCPVCVLPIGRIDLAIRLALEQRVILCSYGDTLRVPASDGLSLLRAKARGGDIRMIYSPQDALKIAEANPTREVVFFAVGFETTTPPTALVIREAARRGLDNFSVLCCHVLTPPAIAHILDTPASEAVALDGFIGPAHVSVVIGAAPYAEFARRYRKPVVIAGFEPLDVLQAILMLVQQVNDGRAEVQNEFIRAVSEAGSRPMQALMEEVFELRESFEWRGLGEMPASARRIRPAFARHDAEARFALHYQSVPDHKACECGPILRGQKRPIDCRLFGSVCTPENPVGSCMVSNEGACAAHYAYGRYKDIEVHAV